MPVTLPSAIIDLIGDFAYDPQGAHKQKFSKVVTTINDMSSRHRVNDRACWTVSRSDFIILFFEFLLYVPKYNIGARKLLGELAECEGATYFLELEYLEYRFALNQDDPFSYCYKYHCTCC